MNTPVSVTTLVSVTVSSGVGVSAKSTSTTAGDQVGVFNLAITRSPTPFVSSRIVLEMVCCEGVPISATID
jgi:hypothetical protein